MNKNINFTGIKSKIRAVLNRKIERNRKIILNIEEENNKLKVYINDWLVDEIETTKPEDKMLLENIINILVDQVKIQWQLRDNKKHLYKYLNEFNSKYTFQEIEKNCNNECNECKYYEWCNCREKIRIVNQLTTDFGIPF